MFSLLTTAKNGHACIYTATWLSSFLHDIHAYMYVHKYIYVYKYIHTSLAYLFVDVCIYVYYHTFYMYSLCANPPHVGLLHMCRCAFFVSKY